MVAMTLSCGQGGVTPATQVMLVITADAELAARTIEVRVAVTGTDEEAEVEEGSENVEGRDISVSPVRASLLPRGNDPARRYVATLELVDSESQVIGTQTLSGGFVQDEYREVWVQFDTECEHLSCAEGFRCQEGRCVEYCVEPVPPPETETRSGPIACDEPCTVDRCENALEWTCDSGTKVQHNECALGCKEGTDQCQRIAPSNVSDVALPADLPHVVAEDDIVFDTDTGVVTAVPSVGDPVEVPGVPFEVVGVPGESSCDGGTLEYGVFFVESLQVLTDIALRGIGERPLIIVSDGDVTIDGSLDLAATLLRGVGSGGCPGGTSAGQDAQGPGAGGKGNPATPDGWSGGGGASHGSLGADGAEGGTDPRVVGGAAGVLYGIDETLVPLLGGSGGGAGGDGDGVVGNGGAGGGAIQISSLAGRVTWGDKVTLTAVGVRGEAGFQTGGGGGGSGGSVLFEGAQFSFTCPPAAMVPVVRVQLGGGVGGAGHAGGSVFGNGGGAGTGRMRINTLDGTVPCGDPCWVTAPLLSCGEVSLR